MACSYTVLFNNGTVAHGPATAITAATLGGLTPFTEYALVLLASNAQETPTHGILAPILDWILCCHGDEGLAASCCLYVQVPLISIL